MPSLVLLGDSILDNHPYVAPAPDTAQLLRGHLGPSWTVELIARDGSTMGDVLGTQATRLRNPDCAILSVGGNDAVEHLGILDRGAQSVAEVLSLLAGLTDTFAADYRALVADLTPRVRRLILCTIYEVPLSDPVTAKLVTVPLTQFNDAIIRTGREGGLDVIDLRAVCTEPSDFVQEIEPSPTGAEKIARAIAKAVGGGAGDTPSRVFAA